MPRQHHNLKTESHYYRAIERGDKTFELRKNDRNFETFDMLCLQESVGGVLTGRELEPKEISYVFRGGQYGLAEDYCILCWRD